MNKEWQEEWDKESKGRHFYKTQNKVGETRNQGGNGKEQVTLSGLRIWHCQLNGTLHIIGKHPTGNCDMCQVKESVEHVFMSCPKYELNRRTMMTALQRMAPVGNRVEDVLRCGDTVEG